MQIAEGKGELAPRFKLSQENGSCFTGWWLIVSHTSWQQLTWHNDFLSTSSIITTSNIIFRVEPMVFLMSGDARTSDRP